jgi:hypothetical protein
MKEKRDVRGGWLNFAHFAESIKRARAGGKTAKEIGKR